MDKSPPLEIFFSDPLEAKEMHPLSEIKDEDEQQDDDRRDPCDYFFSQLWFQLISAGYACSLYTLK